MGTQSLNKRSSKSKRSTSKPDILMPPSQTSHLTFKKVPLFVLLVMAFGGFALLGISSIMWRAPTSTDHFPKFYTIQVVNEFPHDPNAFTQSSVRRVALHSGKVEVILKMDRSYFGEGLTLLGERFVAGLHFVYRFDSAKLVIAKHVVKYKNHEVRYLNELEFVNGEVWANVWQTDCIARISRKDGTVLGWILLENLRKGLVAAGQTGIDVLNGIAWIAMTTVFLVRCYSFTGKLWPKLYEIKLQPLKKHVNNGVIKQLCLP
ncbi:hypothetical protein GH714_028649 [Hevea brasiliensis]|uniref:Uncharacterized protein n=1 Tax=Hevea brasiliensis TaxID=3981 RepID=A0A6A6MEM9_HEVBR|nr:hypothetical protein GH714_028649 [Hevea brasiliensis]